MSGAAGAASEAGALSEETRARTRDVADGEAIEALGFRLHHVGMATHNLDATAKLLEGLFGYRTIAGPFTDPIQRVAVSFLTMSDEDRVEVELVEPRSDDSPVRSILDKSGGAAYHLCLETADLDAALVHARRLRCMLVSAPAPAVAFEGRRIAWIYTPARQLVELVESAKSG